jgi:hypothetical protein
MKTMKNTFLCKFSKFKLKEMGKKIKYTLFILIGMMVLSTASVAQIPDEIIFSLKTGNAAKLAKHFSQNVELMVLDSENVYSKAHAQQVMNDFFKKYPPSNFTIIHQGGKDDSSYAIGNLQVENNRFRVYFLIKSKSGASYIHQLRIERQTN